MLSNFKINCYPIASHGIDLLEIAVQCNFMNNICNIVYIQLNKDRLKRVCFFADSIKLVADISDRLVEDLKMNILSLLKLIFTESVCLFVRRSLVVSTAFAEDAGVDVDQL
jgi:hypothetical protein